MFQSFKSQQQLLSTHFHPLKLIACQVYYRSSGTNRTGGYEIKQTRFHLLRRKMERTFTKTYLQDFGFYSLESTKLVLERFGTKNRFLDPKKREQLTKIYMSVLPSIICEEDGLENVLITKLELPHLMNEIRVFWKCTGDVEKDEETKNLLDEYSEKLRKDISEIVSTFIPQFKFIEDRQHLVVQEMDQLFKHADYGDDYRAFSKIGANLGRDLKIISEDEKEKRKTPPRWLDSWRRKFNKELNGHERK
ncbi:unnamed protein product [Meloidogyne enterolobii]|uniref:Uncharacterized protein n=1 Tax=Meloidogyne enterolobii TaxID=390850 RepID=A0ACB0YVM9_MELEN